MDTMTEPGTAIVEAPDRRGDGVLDLALLPTSEIDAICDGIRRAAENRHKLVLAALTLARPYDWIDFGGKPYLEGAGALRIAGIGIAFGEPVFSKEIIGDDIFVECRIVAEWARFGVKLTELGSCSTLDKFFLGSPGGRSAFEQAKEAAQGDIKLAKLAILSAVRKKALSNAYSRVVTGIMGIRGLTYDDLKAAGISKESSGASVGFAKGGETKRRTTNGKPAAFASIKDLLSLALGSKCSTRGTVGRISKSAKYANIEIGEGGVTTTIHFWTESLPDWVTPGALLYTPDITVGEYKGNRQYACNHIEQVEEGGDDGDGN